LNSRPHKTGSRTSPSAPPGPLRRRQYLGWAVLLLGIIVGTSQTIGQTPTAASPVEQTTDAASTGVLVEYFYEKGCPICARISREVLPAIESSLEGLYTLKHRHTADKATYLELVRYQKKLNITKNASAVFIVDQAHAFVGWDEISGGLQAKVEELALERLQAQPLLPQPEPQQPAVAAPTTPPVPQPPEQTQMDGEALLHERFGSFTVIGVALAGLVDGINPCAIATLVFLMSMLAVLKIRGRRLLLAGSAFCLASFVTYTAIGLGLLRALYALEGFERIRTAIEWVMFGLLAVLALQSFVDAWRYHRTGKADAVSLKLPAGIKLRINRLIREGMGSRRLFTGATVAGCLVTALESVCTGQVYVPALVLIIKSGSRSARAILLLLLYNALFVTPLVIALILTFRGLETKRLLDWSRRNVTAGKIALGALFATMAVLLLLL
jgi:cytochrome c biogenesis protein CcdA